MIKLKTFQDIVDNISTNQFSNEIIKDILFDVYTFEKEFDKELYPNNEVIILNTNEEYSMPSDISEFEIDIDNYSKTLYIISDSGEGVIVYRKKETKNE